MGLVNFLEAISTRRFWQVVKFATFKRNLKVDFTGFPVKRVIYSDTLPDIRFSGSRIRARFSLASTTGKSSFAFPGLMGSALPNGKLGN